MENFKLTTKSEVLSYLEDKKISLQKDDNYSSIKATFAKMGGFITVFKCGRSLRTVKETVEMLCMSGISPSAENASLAVNRSLGNALVFAFGTIICFTFYSIYINKANQCEYQLKETEKKIRQK